MTEVAATATPAVPATPRKGAAKAAKPKAASKPKVKPDHPPVKSMVNAAIRTLKERNGSSLQAIKKYVAANYKVDIDRVTPFIRKYLKSAVTKGTLVQAKGKGASGSFKLNKATKEDNPKPVKKAKAKAPKPKAAKSKVAKSPKPKKVVAAVAKKPAAKKPKAAKPASKAAKPAAKPKAAAKPAKAPKKAVAKKPAAKKTPKASKKAAPKAKA